VGGDNREGGDVRTLVIVEPGSCHDGVLNRLLALAEEAAAAEADVFKMQYWSDPDALADRRRVPDYYRKLYRQYRPNPGWLDAAKLRCIRLGLRLGVTVYLPQDVPLVAQVADVFKVASFEAEARDMFAALRPFIGIQPGKGLRPLVVSLGMGARWPDLPDHTNAIYLKCVSAYPAPVEALHLSHLWPHDERGPFDGLSDHTDPALTWTGALAVAAGARTVEAHLRLDDTDPLNPDSPHAMTPRQFCDYVRHIRFAESCVGDPDDYTVGVLPCEEPMARFKVVT
jgi:sialic acid synthase SpsE